MITSFSLSGKKLPSKKKKAALDFHSRTHAMHDARAHTQNCTLKCTVCRHPRTHMINRTKCTRTTHQLHVFLAPHSCTEARQRASVAKAPTARVVCTLVSILTECEREREAVRRIRLRQSEKDGRDRASLSHCRSRMGHPVSLAPGRTATLAPPRTLLLHLIRTSAC